MRSRATAALFFLSVSLALAPAASAATEPGTPVAVAPGVPDQGRAWELVTPPDAISALLYNVRALSADGNHVFYMTFGSLPGAPAGAPIPTANISDRSASGWIDHPVGAPYPLLGAPGYPYNGPRAFSPDLSTSIWPSFLPLRPGGSEQDAGLFRRAPGGAFALLAEFDGLTGHSIGASEDMQRVFFVSEEHLLDSDATRVEGFSIYEIDGSTLHQVDVGEDGASLSPCGSTVLSDGNGLAKDGAISSDGQRVFFSAHPTCSGPSGIYLRQGGATTTEISASQCDLADCGPESDVSFVGATPSGSAFLRTEQRLTDEDTNSHADLYRYDVANGVLTLLSSSPGEDGVVPKSESVQVSADGSRVYFYGSPQLGPGAVGEEGLYLADHSGLRSIARDPFLAGISADGRYALLFTAEALTAGDTDERADLYRYDAESATVTPISVAGPAGGNGPFDVVTRPEYIAETVPGQPYRSMSEDGSRIFFSTVERLVPQDHNEATDVYEWANGSLGLISSGVSDLPDVYLGATPDGRSVFFRTTATLLPSDRDGGEMDFYVARIGGGFPESTSAAACDVTSCPPPSRGRAGRALPASAKTKGRGIGLRLPTPAARRRFAASGWITLLIEAPEAGHLLAQAQAQIGHRTRTIASTAVDLSQAGPVGLRMHLSSQARRRLAAGDSLSVHLLLHLSGLSSTRGLSFELEGAR